MRRGVLNDTTELRKLILENPDLPIAVLVDDELCTGDYTWMYAPNVRCVIGEILDCEQEIDECKVYNDRIEFEEDLIDYLSFKCETISDIEFEDGVRKELELYEPYWKKCIMVWAGL